MFRKSFRQLPKETLSQAAVELAIFGAIVMFIVGLIFRTGLHNSHSMNVQLRAMRFAMSESFKTAEGFYRGGGGDPSGARNTANVLLIEDRLSGDSGMKLGERDRIPYVASGSGTFSKNLFLVTDLDEIYSLPTYDVIINGQRFPFTTAAFRDVALSQGNAPPLGDDGNPLPQCNAFGFGTAVPDEIPDVHPPYGICWEPNCFSGGGCTIMFRRTYNYTKNREWCDGNNIPGTKQCTITNMPLDSLFDLNFDGTTDVLKGTTVPCAAAVCPFLRDRFSWQWIKVAGVERGSNGSIALGIDPGDTQEAKYPSNTSVDVDGDLEEETIFTINAASNGRLRSVRVMDYQEGDIDLGRLDKLGLDRKVIMLSHTESSKHSTPGTYYRIEEGKLFDGLDGHFVRNTTRQEHADIIWRQFRVSNNTGRFCSNHLPTAWGGDWGRNHNLHRLTNPVEVCVPNAAGEGNCAMNNADPSKSTINRTCFDTENMIIHVRSRIQDLRGRRWVTRFDPQD